MYSMYGSQLVRVLADLLEKYHVLLAVDVFPQEDNVEPANVMKECVAPHAAHQKIDREMSLMSCNPRVLEF